MLAGLVSLLKNCYNLFQLLLCDGVNQYSKGLVIVCSFRKLTLSSKVMGREAQPF